MAVFKAGLFVGRMQHIHLMHQTIISTGLEYCDKFLVFVGSAQIGREDASELTSRNPFPAHVRIKLINEIYANEIKSGHLIVAPLDDLTHEDDHSAEWGRYLLDHAEEVLGQKLDYMCEGADENCKAWFSPDDRKGLVFHDTLRVENSISGTKLRNYLMNFDYDEWSKFTDPKIHRHFFELQNWVARANLI
jgi:bifunctional NMN adenylyltransferase/nudix hydrolase